MPALDVHTHVLLQPPFVSDQASALADTELPDAPNGVFGARKKKRKTRKMGGNGGKWGGKEGKWEKMYKKKAKNGGFMPKFG